MKKKSLGSLALLVSACAALAFALCMAGCKPEAETGKADTAWLIGPWKNDDSGASFTIHSNLTFDCDIYPDKVNKARVRGRLDNSPAVLAANEFKLRDLTAAGPNDPDSSYTTGNAIMPQPMLNGFNKTLTASLTPTNDEKTEFRFKSNSDAADQFFAGIYTKQLP